MLYFQFELGDILIGNQSTGDLMELFLLPITEPILCVITS